MISSGKRKEIFVTVFSIPHAKIVKLTRIFFITGWFTPPKEDG